MKEESKKHKQVSALIQREFSAVVQRIGAPLYGKEPMVTVMRVRMSADLGIAYIYLSVYNVDNKQAIIDIVNENTSAFRGELGNRIRKQMRSIPSLKFFLDDTLDEVAHIDQMFAQLNTNQDSTRSMRDAKDE